MYEGLCLRRDQPLVRVQICHSQRRPHLTLKRVTIRPTKSCSDRSLKLQTVWSASGCNGFVWLIMQPVSDTIYTISWLANHHHRPRIPQSPFMHCWELHYYRWNYHVVQMTHMQMVATNIDFRKCCSERYSISARVSKFNFIFIAHRMAKR